MKYQIRKIEGTKHEIVPNGSDLTESEAENLLTELHLLESCHVDARVSPIITLWHSTILGAFSVSRNKNHYQYKIMQDHFNEMAQLFKPKQEITHHFNLN